MLFRGAGISEIVVFCTKQSNNQRRAVQLILVALL